MKGRKLVAIALSLGYLAAAHCRVACAFSAPPSAVVEGRDADCHHDESKDHQSKGPCGGTHIDASDALLPTDALTLAPRIALSFVAIVPSIDAAAASLRLLDSSRNHDPPRLALEVLSKSSLAPRAPPVSLL